jgi:hypothetical protein
MLPVGGAGQTIDTDHSKPGSKPAHKVSKKKGFTLKLTDEKKQQCKYFHNKAYRQVLTRGEGDKDKIFNIVSDQKYKFIKHAVTSDYSVTIVFLFEAPLFSLSGFLWWTLMQYLNL